VSPSQAHYDHFKHAALVVYDTSSIATVCVLRVVVS